MSADPMTVKAARTMNARYAVACNVDPVDTWALHGDEFLADAGAVLDAIGAPALLNALQTILARKDRTYLTAADHAMALAAIAQTTKTEWNETNQAADGRA